MAVIVWTYRETCTDVVQGAGWTVSARGHLVVTDHLGMPAAEFPAGAWTGVIKLQEVRP